jgi:signal transduction histidine kinase
VGVLSAGIAHEIGSPLAVIRGRAEQVLAHFLANLGDAAAKGNAARTEDLRVIIKHIDNITTTIPPAPRLLAASGRGAQRRASRRGRRTGARAAAVED